MKSIFKKFISRKQTKISRSEEWYQKVNNSSAFSEDSLKAKKKASEIFALHDNRTFKKFNLKDIDNFIRVPFIITLTFITTSITYSCNPFSKNSNIFIFYPIVALYATYIFWVIFRAYKISLKSLFLRLLIIVLLLVTYLTGLTSQVVINQKVFLTTSQTSALYQNAKLMYEDLLIIEKRSQYLSQDLNILTNNTQEIANIVLDNSKIGTFWDKKISNSNQDLNPVIYTLSKLLNEQNSQAHTILNQIAQPDPANLILIKESQNQVNNGLIIAGNELGVAIAKYNITLKMIRGGN